jgi:hypothetical protein
VLAHGFLPRPLSTNRAGFYGSDEPAPASPYGRWNAAAFEGEPTFRNISGLCVARVLPLRRPGKAQSIAQNVAHGAIRVAAQHQTCGISRRRKLQLPRSQRHRFENARQFFSIRPIRLKLKTTTLDGRHAQITFGGYQFAFVAVT